MMVYIFLLLFVFVCGLILYRYPHSRDAKILFLLLTFGVMTIILGLRGEYVGEDTKHYLTMFQYADRVTWKEMLRSTGFRTVWYIDQYGFHDTVENGWLALCKVVHLFTDNGQAFLFVVSALTCGLFAKFIYDNSASIFYSTVIFLCESMFMFSFNGARQMLAVAITLSTYSALKKRKIKTAVIYVLLAALIHNTALVTFAVFPFVLIKQKDSYKKFKYAIVAAALSPFAVMALKTMISRFIPRYAPYFSMNYWTNSAGGIAVLWVAEFALILVMYVKKFKVENSFQYSCFTLMYLAFELMGLQISVFGRVAYYFRSYLLLFFPCADLYFSKNSRRAVRCAIIILIILLYFSYARSDARAYSPFWMNY